MSLSERIISQACSSSEFFNKHDPIPYSEEKRVLQFINSKFPTCRIQRVERLCNEYLFAAFKIKQFEMKSARVEEMLHATGAHNVSLIEKTNLDWRKTTRGMYGYGVSFTKNAFYANKYCSRNNGHHRAFIICDVLLNKANIVNRYKFNGPTHPPSTYDTNLSLDGKVYVKFEDFTFYPKYAAYYDFF